MKNKFSTLFIVLLLSVFSLSFFASATLFAESPASPCPYIWEKNIRIGSTGDDVLKLQQFLNSDSDTTITLIGTGSVGKESTYYGPRTALGMKKFQEKYRSEVLTPVGLTVGSGFVGTLTRAKLNALCTAKVMSVVTEITAQTKRISANVVADSTAENVLTISVPDQPASTLAPAGAGWVPFTSVVLTAGKQDVTVSAMTIERVGVGSDGAFDSLQLADEEENAIGPYRSFRSDHKVELGEAFVIVAGQAKTITVMGNMATDLTDYDGQMPALRIVDIKSSAKLVGTLPVRGTFQTVNTSLVIGKAHSSLSQYDPRSSTNRYINDTNIRFSGVRFNADSKENLELSSITWDQTGTASNGDIKNIKTFVNGISYPTEVKGRKYTSVFDPPVLVKKGYTVDVHVEGDLTATGSDRTVKFDIRQSADVSFRGQSFGYYVLISLDQGAATSGNSVFITSDGTTDGTEGSPFFSGSIVSIKSGSFTNIDK
ncbi:MAG: hypothetical protein EXS59_01320 [Candidatus Taylorbacteria bacterium]|nr:hypothetical protein [Candidatus Taylorbacteria bacterium]